jgi:mono/diheme cytochrome c family protein
MTTLLLVLLIPFTGLVACDALAPGRSPGEKLYRKHCANCHGIDGKGQTVRFMGNTWANIVDDYWRYGGDPASLEHTLRTDLVFQHESIEGLSPSDFKQIVKHVVKLRNP